ncbi:MAG TPA: hypothetical protein VG675_04930 [Bryobacteraceae bacterium]|nr:hypothetical protein [Bryobacteraceae bacterium]
MKRRKDSGFALLLVFLMAAVIAIALYREIPRVAFQAQRQKEQLLIDRGEQYKRAIEIFWRTNNHRYPMSLDDLDKGPKRFLRRRYPDPITGKSDWRIIHIGPNGAFTDSLLNKGKKQQDDQSISTNTGAYVGEQAGIGQTLDNGQQQNTNPALRRRASEGGAAVGADGQPLQTAGGFPMPGNPGAPNPGEVQPLPGQPLYPGQQPNPAAGTTPLVPGMSGFPAQAAPGQLTPGQVPPSQLTPGQVAAGQLPPGLIPGRVVNGQMPGAQNTTGQSSYVGDYSANTSQPYVPGQQGAPFPGAPRSPVNMGTGGMTTFPTGAQPGTQALSGNSQLPGALPNTSGANPAAAMIQRILTSPRPGGMQGINGNTGNQITGTLAGVASLSEDDAIMVYNDQTSYNDWEFVFDYTKVKPVPNPNTASAGMAIPNAGAGTSPFGNNASPFGNNGTGANAAPGNSNASGSNNSNSGFGQGAPTDIRMGRP